MSKLEFFISTAAGNLRRGGQRAWVALLCIAFGVMSLIAMSTLSQSIARALLLQDAERLGADASLSFGDQDFLAPEQVAELQKLQAEGIIQKFILVSTTSDLIFRPSEGSDYHAATGIGVDPAGYPLAGRLTLREPGNIGLSSLLLDPGDVLLTRDLADTGRLGVGDAIILSTLSAGAPVQGRVRGIVTDTPNHQGSKIYYSLATAALLFPGRPAANVALAMCARPEELETRLIPEGWSVTTGKRLAAGDAHTQAFFDLLLKGAGILGLLVGGIGIANTMQVLLKRSQVEIAVWKTIGYTALDLQLMFAVEAAILGALGSALGAGLGLLVSYQLVSIFQNTGNLLIRWEALPSLPLVLASMLVGLVTMVIFALWAIVSASKVPPLTLLRNEPSGAFRQTWKQTLLLAALLGLPFTAVASLVMGSPVKGAGVLLFALAGLVILGGLLRAAAWLLARLLPFGRFPLAKMAQAAFKRSSRSLVFAMIALFAGVVTLALGVVITQNAGRVMSAQEIDLQGYTVGLIAPGDQDSAVRQALASQGAEGTMLGYQTRVRSIVAKTPGGDVPIPPYLIGRPRKPYDYMTEGAYWGSVPDGVYLPHYDPIPMGAEVQVTLKDGSTRIFHAAGKYGLDYGNGSLPPEIGLLMPSELFLKTTPAETLTAYAGIKGRAPAQVSLELSRALPQATVINLAAYAMRFTQAYYNVFILALVMASLALLAGALLVANSVSLAMLDRRYEIGILKSIGYSRAHIQMMLAMEYGLAALLASVAGLSAVAVFLWVMGWINRVAQSLMVMSPLDALAIGAGCTALIVGTVIAVTWRDTQASPLLALNDQG